MFGTIMVPLDGSLLAERALPYAEAVARAAGARLALVRAAGARSLPGQKPGAAHMAALEGAETYLEQAARRIAGPGLSVDTGVTFAGAVEGIMDEIDFRRPDLIVMATHGRGGLGRLALGSVVWTLVTRTAVPILLVRIGQPAAPAQPFAERPKILVPADGSVLAKKAPPLDAALADLLGGELLLLQAISSFARGADADERAVARRYLDGLAARFASPGRRISCEIRAGTPAAAIAAAGRDDGAALDGLGEREAALEGAGRTVVYAALDGAAAGLIAIAAAVRPTAREAVTRLRALGIEVAMLTGDNRATAERIAGELGIATVFSDVLPGQKADKVRMLQGRGRLVAMIGDRIYDAPALAQADVGIAIGAGTDVAMEADDVDLMRSDPVDVIGAIVLSRATVRKMRQNLFWPVGDNSVAFPIAADLFYPAFGLLLRPEIAALTMAGSSLLVATNAVMLKRLRLPGIRRPAPQAWRRGLPARVPGHEPAETARRACGGGRQPRHRHGADGAPQGDARAGPARLRAVARGQRLPDWPPPGRLRARPPAGLPPGDLARRARRRAPVAGRRPGADRAGGGPLRAGGRVLAAGPLLHRRGCRSGGLQRRRHRRARRPAGRRGRALGSYQAAGLLGGATGPPSAGSSPRSSGRAPPSSSTPPSRGRPPGGLRGATGARIPRRRTAPPPPARPPRPPGGGSAHHCSCRCGSSFSRSSSPGPGRN